MKPTGKSSTRVLVADPDPSAAQKLRTLLESWDYDVEVLSSGPDVLQRLQQPDSPAIALLDNNLPHICALEITHKLRQRLRKNPIWIMVTSAKPTPEQIRLAGDAGVDDFLVKPLLETDLRVRLSTAERVQLLHCELNHSIEAARFHATHDHLTGAWNREAMLGVLFQETDRVQRLQTPLSLMLLDMDGFATVNEEYGSSVGDQILQQVVERLRRYLRSYDLIGRYGEDEFLLALPGCAPEDARKLAARLRRILFGRPFSIGATTVAVSASFGVAHSRGRSPLVVLREAEQSLAEAKSFRRNSMRRNDEPLELAAGDPDVESDSQSHSADENAGIPSRTLELPAADVAR